MSVSLNPPSNLGFHRPLTQPRTRSLALTNHNDRPVAFKVKTNASKRKFSCTVCAPTWGGWSPVKLSRFKALREEPPIHAKCKDKFLIQSTLITPDKESMSLHDFVHDIIVRIPSVEPGVELDVQLYEPVIGQDQGPLQIVAGNSITLTKDDGLTAMAARWAAARGDAAQHHENQDVAQKLPLWAGLDHGRELLVQGPDGNRASGQRSRLVLQYSRTWMALPSFAAFRQVRRSPIFVQNWIPGAGHLLLVGRWKERPNLLQASNAYEIARAALKSQSPQVRNPELAPPMPYSGLTHKITAKCPCDHFDVTIEERQVDFLEKAEDAGSAQLRRM
ncbi:hypothetical protein FISHEDRAFT_61616 [Fistulina hepatica ATCC 64428]|uniref:MSP domain-containing protein n=1 Tax=Fistulina hepatica ATCC 64428 TaxID=1128425 RepID=A0A0D7A302_9AGAR|nr:hypothetical protein FISHEDRAFT_61616 [Fistulina hepatica ATCC 64428]